MGKDAMKKLENDRKFFKVVHTEADAPTSRAISQIVEVGAAGSGPTDEDFKWLWSPRK
jgi:hypothetical protein